MTKHASLSPILFLHWDWLEGGSPIIWVVFGVGFIMLAIGVWFVMLYPNYSYIKVWFGEDPIGIAPN